MKRLLFLVVTGMAAVALAAPPAAGPSKAELARLARCKANCALTAKLKNHGEYVAKLLPVGTHVSLPGLELDVPAHWTLAASNDGNLIVNLGPSSRPMPNDPTMLALWTKTEAAPPRAQWIEEVQRLDRPIDARFPIADSEHDKTTTERWNGQDWVVRAVDQRDSARLWYAVTYQGGRHVFVTARAAADRKQLVADLLASLKLD